MMMIMPNFNSVRSLLFLILFLVFWALITEIEVIRNFKHILPYNPTPTPILDLKVQTLKGERQRMR